MAGTGGGRCVLRSRNGVDATQWFPEVSSGLAWLRGGPHILDGEVCVLDEISPADVDKLHARAMRRKLVAAADPVVFCDFDALVIKDRSTMGKPWTQRKVALARLLAGRPSSALYVGAIEGDGEALRAGRGAAAGGHRDGRKRAERAGRARRLGYVRRNRLASVAPRTASTRPACALRTG